MNIITTPLNQSKRERISRRSQFCASVGLLTLLVLLISLTVVAEDTKTEEPPSDTSVVETQTTENTVQKANTTEESRLTTEATKEQITGTSNRMERYEQEGITILIEDARTVRYNEQGVEIGFLNADKITLKTDTETDQTVEIVAEGNVEIRDQGIFATCDHAIMNNLTNTITLKENVVVLQNKDRLETKLFTFNRTTGKQTGEGGVKFKVTVTQAPPTPTEADENTETGTDTDESETSTSDPEKTEEPTEEDANTENGTDESDTGDGTPETPSDADGEPATDTETPNESDTDEQSDTGDGTPETPSDADGEPATDTETPNESDTDTETEETETN